MDGECDLALRAAAGDMEAFGALVTRLEPRVRRFLRRAAGHAADDLAQEAFLRAWQRRMHWRGEGSYAGWVLRIAWTIFLDTERSTARRLRREVTADVHHSAITNPELSAAVAQALAALTSRDRALVDLCLVQGFSHGEAAAILSLPLGTAKSALARARAQLMHLLGEPS